MEGWTRPTGGGGTSPAERAVPERPQEGVRPWGGPGSQERGFSADQVGGTAGFGTEDPVHRLLCALPWRWSAPLLMADPAELDHAHLGEPSVSWGCI